MGRKHVKAPLWTGAAVVLTLLLGFGLGGVPPANGAASEDAKWRAHMAAAEKALDRLNYPRARRYLEKALMRADSKGLEDEALMETLIKLGDVRRVLRHPEDAMKLFERAHRIGEKKFGGSHPLVAKTLFNTGLLADDFRKRKAAEAYYRRALAVGEQSLDPDDLLRSDIEDKLAGFLVRQRRPDEAEGLLDRSLARRERSAQPDHEALAETLSALGTAYYMQYRLGDSEAVLLRALDLALRTAGPGSNLQLSISSNLLDVRISGDIKSGFDRRSGVVRDAINGIEIIAAPPQGEFTAANARRGVSDIKAALTILYERSPFVAGKLRALTEGGRPMVIFDLRFPFGSGSALIGAFYSFIFDDRQAPAGKKRLPVVVGRNIVAHVSGAESKAARWNRTDLAVTLAHELVGHGLQDLRRGLRLPYEDAECEALLYEYDAHKDLKPGLSSELSIAKRQQIQQGSCLDFKQYMSQAMPAEMPLWEVRELDAKRLIENFNAYAKAVMRPN